MYPRAKYYAHTEKHWSTVKNPVGTNKYDGASFFMEVQPDGSLKYFSRRPSVKGGYPERSAQLPQLQKKLPQFAGNTYVVELIHSGFKKNAVESHPKLSGILNSRPEKAIKTQEETGPVRAVLHGVVNPTFDTYKQTLSHLKHVQDAFGNPDLMFVAEPHIGTESISNLIDKTKREGREGVVVTSLTEPEYSNPRIKVKHNDTWNLKVTRIIQERDNKGNPKQSMGALEVVDASGRVVCNVGTGFDKADREDAWKNPDKWVNQLIQVKAFGLGSENGKLRGPVFNGFADGEIDTV